MKANASAVTHWTANEAMRVMGLTALLASLLSVNFGTLTISTEALGAPVQMTIAAFADTLLLVYFVSSSRWDGWREWCALLALLYGMVYMLTALETVYLGSLLSVARVASLLFNGAITSAIFAAAVVWAFSGRRIGGSNAGGKERLRMPRTEWIWKMAASSGLYLLFFILVGVLVYAPLGNAVDPVAYAKEQAIAAASATLVFPIELLRGLLWTLLAIPAIVALRFGWRKTGLVVGILMAVPLALTQFLAPTMPFGLQFAHACEIFTENLVFGIAMVWALRKRGRLANLTGST